MKQIKLSRVIGNKIEALRHEITYAITSILDKNNVTSLNIYPYVTEYELETGIIYHLDHNGYGLALTVDSLRYDKEKHKVSLSLSDIDEYNQLTIEDKDLESWQLLTVLATLEELFDDIIPKNELPVLKEGETFEEQ